jgi:hypothetical protein
MKKIDECPFCEGQAILETQKRDLVYRKESFCINQYYYKCAKCKEEYTTNEADEVSLLQAQNQYRAEHFIPFIEQILKTRAKYDISSLKMSEILGLGANGYSNYEKGICLLPR